MLGYGVQSDMQQDCLRAWTASQELGQSTTAAAFWDGAVGVVFTDAGDEYTVSDLTHDVPRFRRGLVDAVQLFGGTGEAHLAAVVNPHHEGSRIQGGTGPEPTSVVD
jgi:hypothetical protein